MSARRRTAPAPVNNGEYFLIPLTKGRFAKVDERDLPLVADRIWQCTNGYACRSTPHGFEKMHRVVLGVSAGRPFVDHINGDTLDNRRSNLRLATDVQSVANQRARGGSSRYKGVTWNKTRGMWQAGIERKIDGKRKFSNLGLFENETDAATAYDKAAIAYHGHYARPNLLVKT